MIKSVVREHHFHPNEIGVFFVDDIDYRGIKYWYNDIVEVIEQNKPKKQ